MAVHIVADLRVEVGNVQAHLTSEGDHLVVVTDDPAELLRHARTLRSSLRSTASVEVAPLGAAHGLLRGLLNDLPDGTRLRLDGRNGPVASVLVNDGMLTARGVRIHRAPELINADQRRRLVLALAGVVSVIVIWRRRRA